MSEQLPPTSTEVERLKARIDALEKALEQDRTERTALQQALQEAKAALSAGDELTDAHRAEVARLALKKEAEDFIL